jgi:hypothetical protein
MSSRIKFRHQRDRDQHLYEEALDRLHIPWVDTSPLGSGFGDLVVGYNRENYIFEIKTDDEVLTVDEAFFHAHWHGRIYIVRCVQDMFFHMGLK